MIDHRQCRHPYDEVPETWDPYEPEQDYCGPGGKWYSRYIPRDICGIDCNVDYYAHDNRYKFGKTKEDKAFADKQMFRDQNAAIKKAVAWWRPLRYKALLYSLQRYHMVKWFGKEAFENAHA
jgi:hypothetical protein